MNPFTKEEKTYPIMSYVYELEDKIRKLQWQLKCNRLGSFISGVMIGLMIALGYNGLRAIILLWKTWHGR